MKKAIKFITTLIKNNLVVFPLLILPFCLVFGSYLLTKDDSIGRINIDSYEDVQIYVHNKHNANEHDYFTVTDKNFTDAIIRLCKDIKPEGLYSLLGDSVSRYDGRANPSIIVTDDKSYQYQISLVDSEANPHTYMKKLIVVTQYRKDNPIASVWTYDWLHVSKASDKNFDTIFPLIKEYRNSDIRNFTLELY